MALRYPARNRIPNTIHHWQISIEENQAPCIGTTIEFVDPPILGLVPFEFVCRCPIMRVLNPSWQSFSKVMRDQPVLGRFAGFVCFQLREREKSNQLSTSAEATSRIANPRSVNCPNLICRQSAHRSLVSRPSVHIRWRHSPHVIMMGPRGAFRRTGCPPPLRKRL